MPVSISSLLVLIQINYLIRDKIIMPSITLIYHTINAGFQDISSVSASFSSQSNYDLQVKCVLTEFIMSSNRQALLLSSSSCHGYPMLEFAKEEICSFLSRNHVSELVFVPYAQTDHDNYTESIRKVIGSWGFKVTGLHTFSDPVQAINASKAIFVGGGNTFLLLKTLYEKNLVNAIKTRVHEGNLSYMGSSAGTNVATKSIHTTNDMPIIYPPTFEAIGIIPFNLNPHYIDTAESDTHKGETREQRIAEYMQMSHAEPVLGLREGSMLHVDGQKLIVKGVSGAVLFLKNGSKTEYSSGADVSFLCQ